METKKRGKKVICIGMLSVAVLLWSGIVFSADMCQIIRVSSEKGAGSTKVMVFPEKITVPVGTCTVWVNWVTRGDVNVSFRENAKQCMLSSKSPSGFNLQDGESCYMSDKLQMGQSASLYWEKPGIFKYTIELTGATTGQETAPGRTVPITGIVEVK